MEYLISVIIACYNGSLYLEETVKSIVDQNHTNWEIVFIDDCSTDESHELFLNLTKKHNIKNFTIRKNDENLGITKTKQKGFENANGEFVFSLDCDDWISPNYMIEMLGRLLEYPKKSFVYCDSVYFYPDKTEHRFYQPEYNVIRLIENNFISYCSLYKKHDLLSVGYDLNNRGHHEDYGLLLSLAYNGKYGIHLGLPLFYYRIHENQSMQSSEVKNNDELFKSYFITQMPELFPENWLPIAKEKLKGLPDNFMSLYGKEFENVVSQKGLK